MTQDSSALDMMLFDYAAGTLDAAESFIVATYLSLNASARQRMADLEAVGGVMLHTLPPATVSPDCLEKTLRAIQNCGEVSPCADLLDIHNDLDLPLPLLEILCGDSKHLNLCWTRLNDHIEAIEICACASQPEHKKLRLLRLASGATTAPLPQEVTVVLQGGYVDRNKNVFYGRGELLVTPSALNVAPEGCVSLCLSQSEKRLFRLIDKIFGQKKRL